MQDKSTPVPIPLRNRHGDIVAHALVDASDADWLSQWSWRRMRLPSGQQYVLRSDHQDGQRITVYLHREVMGLPRRSDGREVDHINHNGLDNRRANLRIGTHRENQQNAVARRGSSSRYRGVSWHKGTRRWQAQAALNGKLYFIGNFTSEEAAGRAIAAWRHQHMPFAVET